MASRGEGGPFEKNLPTFGGVALPFSLGLGPTPGSTVGSLLALKRSRGRGMPLMDGFP